MYLILLGTLFNLSLLGWALGAFDGDGDDSDDRDEGETLDIGDDTIEIGDDILGDDTPAGEDDPLSGDDAADIPLSGDDAADDPLTPAPPGSAEETLPGPDGDDTIPAGDPGDGDDTTAGGDDLSGDDTILAMQGDTVTGGAGADTFYIAGPDEEGLLVTDGFGATITDYEPGIDRILTTSHPEGEEHTPERGAIYDWDVREDGVALTRSGGNGGTTPVDVVFLEGLEVPPEDSDVGVQLILDRTVEETFDTEDLDDFFDAPANFVRHIDGGAGAETFDYNTQTSSTDQVLDGQTGGGDDTVGFFGFRSDVDLGEGDDTYIGLSEIIALEAPAEQEVSAGEGNDFVSVARSLVDIDGGAGDDFLSVTEALGGRMEGGAGDDTLVSNLSDDTTGTGLAPNLAMIGGAGADLFQVEVGDRTPIVADYDESEDILSIVMPSGYDGPGEVTLGASAIGGTEIRVDGMAVATVYSAISDPSLVNVILTMAE